MVNSRYLSALLVCCSLFNADVHAFDKPKHAKTWYEAPDEGWSFYIDPPVRLKLNNKEKDKEQRLSPNKNDGSQGESQESYTHTKTMERLRKDFEELQAKAILNPTLENVAEFQKAYNSIVTRSSSFEKTWMMSSLLSGENYRESDQPSPKHRKIYQEKTEKQLEEDIVALAKIYGIFFIFKNDCPYCHEMAPAVRLLVDQYHFAIKAISPDGQAIEGFPDAVKDNGTIAQINPEGVFPALFLVNPHSGQTIPLARGLTSPSELKENFRAIIQFLKEQKHVR
jgi:conjugal transfer pilus assembly protein TraF